MARRHEGYTYLGVLLVVLVLGMTLTGATLVSETKRRREKEQELIFAGQHYVNAIRSYYESGEGGVSTYPRSVADLLKDPRFPGLRRHLRKPWRDPMTPAGEWDLIVGEHGGIIGVRSRSRQAPLGKFPMAQDGDGAIVGKASYSDWQFRFEPATAGDNVEEDKPPSSPLGRTIGPAGSPDER